MYGKAWKLKFGVQCQRLSRPETGPGGRSIGCSWYGAAFHNPNLKRLVQWPIDLTSFKLVSLETVFAKYWTRASSQLPSNNNSAAFNSPLQRIILVILVTDLNNDVLHSQLCCLLFSVIQACNA